MSIRSEEGYEPGFKRFDHCSWSKGSGMAWYAPAFESLSAGSLRRPRFSSLAFDFKKAQTEWSKAGSIDGNTGGSSLVVGKPSNSPCRQICRYGT